MYELGTNLLSHINCKKKHQIFTMGESSDISVIAQLVIFIRGTDLVFMLVTSLLVV
jgi:hypothetical protein